MTKPSPSIVSDIIARNFSVSGGRLQIGGIDANELADKYATPLFIYDANLIRQRVDSVRAALGNRFDLFYSIKANPSHSILQLMLELGCGLEVASAGELERALHAGCSPDRIIFAGPGKTEEEIRIALKHRIGELHAESQLELERIAKACQDLDTTASVALRINPKSDAQGGAMRMGGGPAPFGIDEEQMSSAIHYVITQPAIQLSGLHLFVGTQILDHQILLTQYKKLAELAERLYRATGTPVKTLDFGGGWGIPYFSRDSTLDLQQLQPGIQTLVEANLSSEATKSARCILEPGRFLVGESGVYVCRVNDIKTSRGVTYLVTDGGMHHHLAASGNLGQTIKRNFPVAFVNRLDQPNAITANIVGPLCTPLDMLARNLDIPEPMVGDLVGVFQSGAYARSASPLSFLSHRRPAEVLVDGDAARAIQARGQWSDYVADV